MEQMQGAVLVSGFSTPVPPSPAWVWEPSGMGAGWWGEGWGPAPAVGAHLRPQAGQRGGPEPGRPVGLEPWCSPQHCGSPGLAWPWRQCPPQHGRPWSWGVRGVRACLRHEGSQGWGDSSCPEGGQCHGSLGLGRGVVQESGPGRGSVL